MSATNCSPSDITEFIEFLGTLEVRTVDDAFSLEQRDKEFNLLDDLMTPHHREIFKSLMENVLRQLDFVKSAEKQIQQQKLDLQASIKIQQQLSSSFIHLWNNDSQLLVLPMKDKLNFFCVSEPNDTQNSNEVEKGEHMIFCLDISSSMNHDEKGIYCAPKSPDHPSSSIKKARELIPSVFLASLKKQTPITLIVWNGKIKAAIEFLPTEFQDPETTEFYEDEKIVSEIRRRTSEQVFVASGGTNIEAALKLTGIRAQKLAPTLSTLVVWLLTDGEETYCLDSQNKRKRIPTSSTDSEYKFFNSHEADGLTPYQRSLVKHMKGIFEILTESRVTLEFHICHFGEADPVFLRSLRGAVDGHFHAVSDIARLKQEMEAVATASGSKLAIFDVVSGQETLLPAAMSEGVIYARGALPLSMLDDIAKNKSVGLRYLSSKNVLSKCDIWEPQSELKQSIQQVLDLEPELEAIISSISSNISHKSIYDGSQQLVKLKRKRMDAIGNLVKLVKSGSMLQSYLEKVLESVENQILALERMLGQHISTESTKYDSETAKNAEFFSQREQLAISAGLESMKVRLGNGFVAKSNLDKRIQRLVATSGNWARRMLNRVCLLGETEVDDDVILSLAIVDGQQLKQAQHEALVKHAKDTNDNKLLDIINHPGTRINTRQDLTHDDTGKEFLAKLKWSIIPGDAPELLVVDKTIPVDKLYDVYAMYTCRVLIDDLEDARERMKDPLSYCTFTDLIKESNTLPAYMYVVGANQSVGLLYNAKELLYVVSGGLESTSFSYFRLYYRLAEKTIENGCETIKIPGAYYSANMALPIAPEPLTNLILSSMMPGLLSEFITGTPMAPLTEIGNLYIGYLMLHMRSKFSGVDITRIAEILSTLWFWIQNPKTLPKVEQYEEMMENMIKYKSIAPGDSAGKSMPVKAFAYSLMDVKHTINDKFEALLFETWRRNFKQLLGKVKGQNTKIPEKLAEHQISLKRFIRTIIRDFASLMPVAEDKANEDIPLNFIEAGKQFAEMMLHEDHKTKAANLMSDKTKFSILVRSFYRVIQETGDKAFPVSFHWSSILQLHYAWYCVATYPFDKLTDNFVKFKAPTEFEDHVSKKAEILKNGEGSFNKTLMCYIEENTQHFIAIDVEEEKNTIVLKKRNLTNRTTEDVNYDDTGAYQRIWQFMKLIFDGWSWKGRSSNVYGLSKIDFDIVRALKDPTGHLTESLTPGQLSEYHSAREHRNKAYAQWAPARLATVSLSADLHKNSVVVQGARENTFKPKLSMVTIGNVDAGKSTLSGHMIVKMGGVTERQLEKLKEAADILGRGSFKYAFVMDKLKNEREQGLTVEVGMWNIVSEKYDIDLLDAPGHRSFMKNMATGSSLADIAILVVSAAPSEFESGIMKGGMTREELTVAYAVGIKYFIVAVNKMDTVKYSEERFKEIVAELSVLFKRMNISLDKVVFLPISAFDGDNLVTISPNTPWFEGWKTPTSCVYTLLQAIDEANLPNRPSQQPLRLPILKAHKIPGVGTVVVGRVASGTLKNHQKLVLMPGNIQTEVKTIEIHHASRSTVIPGDLVGVALANVSLNQFKTMRGLVASDPANHPMKEVKLFTAQIIIWEHPGEIRVGYNPFIYCHTASFSAKIKTLVAKLDKKTIKPESEVPPCLKKGDMGLVQFEVTSPVALDLFSEFPPLARFIVRDGGFTVAYGLVKSIDSVPEVAKGPKNVNVKSRYLK
eukprot:TRINITY_DN2653_c0_g9_i1.p1 TRINITY_DN2653_c0_g9~~TRINITY_DN2653_c0_g9_i1.p1  ORF type:complete len:1829 (+),score=506.01 TRINITY_DN2653_c0_g9_i1:339-5489(+)